MFLLSKGMDLPHVSCIRTRYAYVLGIFHVKDVGVSDFLECRRMSRDTRELRADLDFMLL